MYETTSLAILQTPKCFRSTVDSPSILKCREISPYYIDLRVIPSFPEKMKVVVNDMVDLIDRSMERPGPFNKLVTTADAGIPVCSMVSQRLGVGMGWSKKEAKGYGLGKSLEGYIVKGDNVLGVDDLTTEATTAKKAIQDVRNEGADIHDYCVEHDRNQGAQKILADLNVKLHCLSQTNPRFMKLALENKNITNEEFTVLEKYAQDTHEWSNQYVRNNPEFLRKRLGISNGIISDTAPLEVLTVGHPELLEEFKPVVNEWLRKAGVKQSYPEFGYILKN